MHHARAILAIAVLGAAIAAGVVSGQQAKPAAPSTIEKVKDGLYVIRGPFNRCAPNGCSGAYADDGLLHEAGDVAVRVTPEGLVLVDDKFQENVPDVLEKVKSVSNLPIRYLLNTHHHTDHAGGNQGFVSRTEVVAHRNVRANFLKNKQPGAPRVTFADEASVFLGGIEVRAYHFGRGHTDGDTVVYFPDLRVIHSGDLITSGMPVMDYRNGASAVEWVTVLDRMLQLDFDTVIPGHGPLMTKAQVRADRDKLVKMNQRMTDLVRQGVPKDAVLNRLGLAELGWDHTPSSVAFQSGLSGYYDEMKAQIGK